MADLSSLLQSFVNQPRGFQNTSQGFQALGSILGKQALAEQQANLELQNAIALAKAKANIVSPLDEFLNKGKIADAEMKIFEAGGPRPSRFANFGQVAPSNNVILEQQPNVSKETNIVSSISSEPKPGDIVPKGFDAFGRPTGFETVKKTAAQDKRDVENKELAGQTKNLISLFNRARSEASQGTKGFGEKGIKGRLANQFAIVKGKIGESPAVNTFQDRVSAFATVVAKAAGEVRPTDRDIERFSKALLNLKNNDAENAIQLNQILSDIEAKGHSVEWAKPLVQEFQNITGQSVFPTSTTKSGQTSSGIKFTIEE